MRDIFLRLLAPTNVNTSAVDHHLLSLTLMEIHQNSTSIVDFHQLVEKETKSDPEIIYSRGQICISNRFHITDFVHSQGNSERLHLVSMHTMATFDGYTHVDKLMEKALKEGTTEEELKEAYVAWSKTYEKVRSPFGEIRKNTNSSLDILKSYEFQCDCEIVEPDESSHDSEYIEWSNGSQSRSARKL